MRMSRAITAGAFSVLIASAIGAQQAAAPTGTDHAAAQSLAVAIENTGFEKIGS
jgi:hypothetical protein